MIHCYWPDQSHLHIHQAAAQRAMCQWCGITAWLNSHLGLRSTVAAQGGPRCGSWFELHSAAAKPTLTLQVASSLHGLLARCEEASAADQRVSAESFALAGEQDSTQASCCTDGEFGFTSRADQDQRNIVSERAHKHHISLIGR